MLYPQVIRPADPNANENVVALYHNLRRLAETATMFGHQDDLAYGVDWTEVEGRSDVKDTCGDYPAVSGWDLGEIGKERNLDGVSFSNMRRWMIEVYRRGGINTVSWHMVNLVNNSNSWDTTRSVQQILPGGTHHHTLVAKLDQFAGFVKSLQAGGKTVPLIFRPWHEHNGSWFWWGAGNCTVEEYRQLWRFTVEYLRDRKGVHSLLYAYSTDRFSNLQEYLERYPGDEFVDIFGFDDYGNARSDHEENAKALAREIDTVLTLASERGKLAAWTETGLEGIAMENWFTKVLLPALKGSRQPIKLSWVLLWRNAQREIKPGHFFGPHPRHPSAEDFRQFYADPVTLFLGDLPALYQRSLQPAGNGEVN